MTIRVKLTGGLGNQMFQFAAGYSIARKNNVELSLDLASQVLQRNVKDDDNNKFIQSSLKAVKTDEAKS